MENTWLCTSQAGGVREEEEQLLYTPEGRKLQHADTAAMELVREHWCTSLLRVLAKGATCKCTPSALERAAEKKQGGLLCEHCWNTYIQEPPIAEDAEQRVHMALTGEVEPCPNMAAR